MRIHDLRHSFASGGLQVGEGLSMIGKLPGHTQVQTTARYTHPANDRGKFASGGIAKRIAEVQGNRGASLVACILRTRWSCSLWRDGDPFDVELDNHRRRWSEDHDGRKAHTRGFWIDAQNGVEFGRARG